MVNTLDSAIIDRKKAGKLREDKNQPKSSKGRAPTTATGKLNAAKKEKVGGVKEKIKGAAAMGIQAGTSSLLRMCWINLIPSWGLTIIYINMHVFLRWVVPDAFCKLGGEWRIKNVASHGAKNVGGSMFGIVEIIGLLLIDIILGFLFFMTVSMLVIVADIYANPLSNADLIWSFAWDWAGDAINDILFAEQVLIF